LLVRGKQTLGLIHDRRGEALAFRAGDAGQPRHVLLRRHGDGEVRPGQMFRGA
jgi:hypothetical protein